MFSLLEWVSTSIGASLIMITIIIGLHQITKQHSYKKFIIITATILVAGVISFTISPNVEDFGWFIEGVLGEDLTMDGRTDIWLSALSQIKGNKWFLGNGVSHDYEFALANGAFVSHPHNQYLAIIFIYGIIGLVIFVLMLLKTIKISVEDRNFNNKAILISGFFSIVIMGISMTYFSQAYWLIWYIACHCIVKQDNTSLKHKLRTRRC